MEKQREYKITVRVPEDLHAALDVMRKRHRRTLHAEMLRCFERCIEQFRCEGQGDE